MLLESCFSNLIIKLKPEKEIKQELWDKFQDYEATPQDASWEKIRAAISVSDDAQLKADLAQKFENFEATTETDLWGKIQANIQSEDIWKVELTEKLSDYEAEPKVESWNVIENSISEKTTEKGIFASFFNDFEAEPQDSSWENIQANIPSEDIWKITLSEKLDNYEAEPQATSWNSILSGIGQKDSLKSVLTNKFDGYEAEPTAESWEIIEAAIRKKKKRGGIIIPMYFRMGIAASVALMIGTFWFLSNRGNDANLAVNQTKNTDNQASTSKTDDKQNKNTNKDLKDFSKISKQNKNSENINDSKFSVNSENKTNSSIDISKSVAKNITKQKTADKSILENEKRNQLKSEYSTDNQSIANNTSNNSTISNPDRKPTNSIDEPSKNLTENLNALESADFRETAFNQAFKPIEYQIDLPTEPIEKEKRNNLIYTANLMPVQAYQVYTILPQTSTYIQQIGTLNALDNQRLGVQAKFGVMKPIAKRNLIGATLSYTGIQQYANYQLNNGMYDVQFTDANNYTVTSVTETVNDLQFIQALGLKIENSYLISQRKNRVYLTGGGEASKVLNKNQYGFYVNVAVGVEYKIQNKSLWIEPTFRYGLSQSADNLNYLKIRPYQFGLNVRFNFPTAP